jgi:endonuclease YncB( thermonuclease family)
METRCRVGGWILGRTVPWLAAWVLLTGPVAAEEFTGRVVGVTDGDTIKVLHTKQSETVRLLGVDAPEKRQAYGDRARRFTAELAFDRTVTVRSSGRDRNGRLLGEVVLPDGRSLTRAGAGRLRLGFQILARRARRLEEEARQDRRGLWADAAPTAPWEYRVSGRR